MFLGTKNGRFTRHISILLFQNSTHFHSYSVRIMLPWFQWNKQDIIIQSSPKLFPSLKKKREIKKESKQWDSIIFNTLFKSILIFFLLDTRLIFLTFSFRSTSLIQWYILGAPLSKIYQWTFLLCFSSYCLLSVLKRSCQTFSIKINQSFKQNEKITF